MTQARVQPGNFDRFTNGVRVIAIACDVEPTKDDGQRIRDFMQRARQVGIAN